MNQSVKFTIITITYNAAQWLERTILSILSQSYGNIEYVIIDGASTDGTVDIIRQYAPGVSFWLSEPDKGLYDAMNKGLQHASGLSMLAIRCPMLISYSGLFRRLRSGNICRMLSMERRLLLMLRGKCWACVACVRPRSFRGRAFVWECWFATSLLLSGGK